jgi:small subunit ribosomal protein S21
MNRLMQRLSSLTHPLLLHHGESLNAAAISLGGAQTRGIRVQVRDGNLEQALGTMERRMRASGMERLIKGRVDHHLKNSEKKVIAKKKLLLKVRSQELARKLRTILVKKIRFVLCSKFSLKLLSVKSNWG